MALFGQLAKLLSQHPRNEIVLVADRGIHRAPGPSRVKTGSPAGASECPLLGVQQTSNLGDLMSACRQTRAFAAASERFTSVTVLLSTVRLRTVQAAKESG